LALVVRTGATARGKVRGVPAEERFGTTRQLPTGGDLFGTIGTTMHQEYGEGPPGPNSCTSIAAEKTRTRARTPDVDGRRRRAWKRLLCRAACGLRSVPLGDTAKKPCVFERHEVRELLAG